MLWGTQVLKNLAEAAEILVGVSGKSPHSTFLFKINLLAGTLRQKV
jgi:hypothetical protein